MQIPRTTLLEGQHRITRILPVDGMRGRRIDQRVRGLVVRLVIGVGQRDDKRLRSRQDAHSAPRLAPAYLRGDLGPLRRGKEAEPRPPHLVFQCDWLVEELKPVRLTDPAIRDRPHKHFIGPDGHTARRQQEIAELRPSEAGRVIIRDLPRVVSRQRDLLPRDRFAVQRKGGGGAGLGIVQDHHRVLRLLREHVQPRHGRSAAVQQKPPQALHRVDGQKRVAANEAQPPTRLQQVQALDDEERVGLLLDLQPIAPAERTVQTVLKFRRDGPAEWRVADDGVEVSREHGLKEIRALKVMSCWTVPPTLADSSEAASMEKRVEFHAVDIAAQDLVQTLRQGSIVKWQKLLDEGQEKRPVAETRFQHSGVAGESEVSNEAAGRVRRREKLAELAFAVAEGLSLAHGNLRRAAIGGCAKG